MDEEGRTGDHRFFILSPFLILSIISKKISLNVLRRKLLPVTNATRGEGRKITLKTPFYYNIGMETRVQCAGKWMENEALKRTSIPSRHLKTGEKKKKVASKRKEKKREGCCCYFLKIWRKKKKKLEHVHNWIEVKEELQVMKSRAQGEESALSRMRDIYSSEVQRSDIGVDSDGEEES